MSSVGCLVGFHTSTIQVPIDSTRRRGAPPSSALGVRHSAFGVRRSAFGSDMFDTSDMSDWSEPNAERRTPAPSPELSAASHTLIIPAKRRPAPIGGVGAGAPPPDPAPNSPLAGGAY